MEDVLAKVRAWLDDGSDVALATIVAVERKAPRGPGAAMAVGPRREIAGSLSGGCVEPAVVEEAGGVLRDGQPRLVSFGITDDQAFGVGLACGGTIHVFVERLGAADREVVGGLARAVEAGEAAALVTVLAPGGGLEAGAKALVFEDESRPAIGGAGALAAEARAALRAGRTERRAAGGADAFVQSFTPPATLVVVGAVHPAAELCRAAKLVGLRVVVCDPRSPFATTERLPAADEIVREWPDAFLSRRPLGPRDAVAVLTHDLKFDVPALKTALERGVGYVGAMGSRKTQERRATRLREEGVGEADVKRVRSPIGLDIGAETPAEIAVSVVAEIVAWRRGG